MPPQHALWWNTSSSSCTRWWHHVSSLNIQVPSSKLHRALLQAVQTHSLKGTVAFQGSVCKLKHTLDKTSGSCLPSTIKSMQKHHPRTWCTETLMQLSIPQGASMWFPSRFSYWIQVELHYTLIPQLVCPKCGRMEHEDFDLVPPCHILGRLSGSFRFYNGRKPFVHLTLIIQAHPSKYVAINILTRIYNYSENNNNIVKLFYFFCNLLTLMRFSYTWYCTLQFKIMSCSLCSPLCLS